MINPKEDEMEENENYRTNETRRIQIILWSISYVNCR